ncbi:hypothetical protein [Xanthomarina gelatinilytica]|uniref:hypothetical protein n=1 Tax=Xanthomarina gelatinilytica TaxID=1137281 RepID=UPI003AA7E6E1
MNGFDNENQIINTINSVPFDNLSSDLKNALIKMNGGNTPKVLSAKKYGGSNKADLSITIDGNVYFVSVKKGSGNSIHEEFVEDFIVYLKKNIEENQTVFDDLRHFVWCDGTLDGSGEFKDRMDLKTYKNKFNSKVINIQKYFDKHNEKLINRFLIGGAEKSTTDIDFLLYGNIDKCQIISRKRLIEKAISIKKKPISISYLTFQVYNRRLTYIEKQEFRRGKIQLKWGTLQNDIKNI